MQPDNHLCFISSGRRWGLTDRNYLRLLPLTPGTRLFEDIFVSKCYAVLRNISQFLSPSCRTGNPKNRAFWPFLLCLPLSCRSYNSQVSAAFCPTHKLSLSAWLPGFLITHSILLSIWRRRETNLQFVTNLLFVFSRTKPPWSHCIPVTGCAHLKSPSKMN